MAEFLMPSLGADMETGKVVQWLVKPGDRVKPGDVVAVVETHKGAIDVEIFLDGVIDELVPLDEALPVGAVLATVAPAGVAASPAPGPAAPKKAARASVAQAPAALKKEGGPAVAAPRALSPAPRAVRVAQPAEHGVARPRISPAARRRAGALGLSVEGLRGTGVDGAVTLADLDHLVTGEKSGGVDQAERAAGPVPAPRARSGGFDAAQMRQAIAAAMSRSKREIPHYYLSESIDFTAASEWLEDWNRVRPPEERVLGAVLLLKATAVALKEFPQLNGFFESGGFRPGPGIHAGWAIALRGGGLVAPALHDADQKSLPELMDAMRDLVQRARAGGLRSSELTDPTITITSLGDRGAESVLGVIYPPQVAIVGFGRVVPRPWVVDGQTAVRQIVSASLAGDHRVSDGHLGGQLLAAIGRALQSPATL
jgi:pyruvate dehydrogenase E2 component (dihydrolipoamide acetyltransferase)